MQVEFENKKKELEQYNAKYSQSHGFISAFKDTDKKLKLDSSDTKNKELSQSWQIFLGALYPDKDFSQVTPDLWHFSRHSPKRLFWRSLRGVPLKSLDEPKILHACYSAIWLPLNLVRAITQILPFLVANAAAKKAIAVKKSSIILWVFWKGIQLFFAGIARLSKMIINPYAAAKENGKDLAEAFCPKNKKAQAVFSVISFFISMGINAIFLPLMIKQLAIALPKLGHEISQVAIFKDIYHHVLLPVGEALKTFANWCHLPQAATFVYQHVLKPVFDHVLKPIFDFIKNSSGVKKIGEFLAKLKLAVSSNAAITGATVVTAGIGLTTTAIVKDGPQELYNTCTQPKTLQFAL